MQLIMEFLNSSFFTVYIFNMKKFLCICVICLATISCRKNNEDTIEGPSLNDLYGPFIILDSLNLGEEVNFEAGENVTFDMELSKRTNWEIELTGSITGAKRSFTGSDRIISLKNANWKGGADQFPSFGMEKTYVTIRFPNEDTTTTIRDSITIKGLKKDQGTLITSFENGFLDHWDLFNQTTVNGSIICSDDSAAKGDCYYKWNGLVSWDWAIGSVQIKATESGFSLPANASTLFFNMGSKMVSNTGPNNCFIEFWFDEDDNEDGVFDESTEDRFIYQYWYESDGWNLISFKYGDLKYDSDGNIIKVKGNGLPEPSKLISINVFFLANKDSGIRSEAYADHIIFTENETYKP